MKRIISFALSFLLAASLLAVPALAEGEGEATTTTGSGQEPTQPVSGIPSDFNLEFKEFTVSGNTLTIKWNREASNGATVTGVRVDGTDLAVSNGDSDTVTVALNKLRPGVYKEMEIYLRAAGAAAGREEKFTKKQTLAKGGDIDITIKPLELNGNGQVVATLVDQYDRPISEYEVEMQVGSVTEKQTTNEKGQAISVTPIGNTDQDKAGVLVIAKNSAKTIENATFNFVGANKSFFEGTITTAPPTNKPTDKPTTSTTPSTQQTTTATKEPEITTGTAGAGQTTADSQETLPTYELVPGAGTTSMVDDKVAVNMNVDTNILTLFGLKKQDFDGQGRLLLSPETYQALVGTSAGSVMLNLLSPRVAISDGLIQGAINGVSDFSTYSVSQRKSVVFDLSLVMTANGVDTEIAPVGGEYMIQIPVPASMKNAEKLAITIYNGSTLETPVPVSVKDGAIHFKASPKGTYVLMGFVAEEDGKAGGVPTLVIVLLIVGVLLLAGAGVLLYFFVIRKPKDDGEDDDEEMEYIEYDELGNPILTGSTGTGEEETAPAETGENPEDSNDQPTEYVRLDDMLDEEWTRNSENAPQPKTPKKKNPNDYDIDL